MSLRQNIEAQLNEVEFLQNLYDSVRVSPHNIKEEFDLFLDGKLDDVYNQLTCTITLKEFNPPVELEVTFPHSYPEQSLRLLTSVRGHSYIHKKFSHYTLNLDQELGTYCVSFLVDFLRDNCISQETPDTREAQCSSLPKAESESCRVWLLSHHIYDKVKRRNLLSLSAEKNLGGFTLPGKPGVICIEGDPEDCAAAVSEIKSWNWQKLGVKFEEKALKNSKFDGRFEELSCYKASQGAGDRPHMDLGVFFKYLEQLQLGFAFQELFGVQGK